MDYSSTRIMYFSSNQSYNLTIEIESFIKINRVKFISLSFNELEPRKPIDSWTKTIYSAILVYQYRRPHIFKRLCKIYKDYQRP